MLNAWRVSLRSSSWFTLDLYTNDYIPQPGDEAGDYTIVTTEQWPGYMGVMLPATGWGEVQVADDTATTSQATLASFVFPTDVQSFTIFGYFVTDGYGNLLWAEMFETAIAVSYPGGLSVVSQLNLGILPDDDEEEPEVRGRRVRRDDDQEDED